MVTGTTLKDSLSLAIQDTERTLPAMSRNTRSAGFKRTTDYILKRKGVSLLPFKGCCTKSLQKEIEENKHTSCLSM